MKSTHDGQNPDAPAGLPVRAVGTILAIALSMLVLCTVCPKVKTEYLKVKYPPDVDKATFQHEQLYTCSYATAANMLAAAGYGGGGSPQQRADLIYEQMIMMGCDDPGSGTLSGGDCDIAHIDTMLDAWLKCDTCNVDPLNPYKFHFKWWYPEGSDEPCLRDKGPVFIGNELRECRFVGISLIPRNNGQAHAITVWGDDGPNDETVVNSDLNLIRVTDSDLDSGGDLQAYKAEAVEIPGIVGGGLTTSVDYPYASVIEWSGAGPDVCVRGVITLSDVDNPVPGVIPVFSMSSYLVQTQPTAKPKGIKYEISTTSGHEMQWWRASIEPPLGTNEVSINDAHDTLTVSWEFDSAPRRDEEITLTTELALPDGAQVVHGEPLWVYSDSETAVAGPALSWRREPTSLEVDPWTLESPTGGYVIGRLDIVRPVLSRRAESVARFRLISQYPYSDDPTRHIFQFQGTDSDLALTNARFGHSYGNRTPSGLWVFGDWTADFWMGQTVPLGDSIEALEISWPELAEYPRGEDYVRAGGHIVTPIGMIHTPTP